MDAVSPLFDPVARDATLEEIEATLDELRQAYRDIASIRKKMVSIRKNLLQLKTRLNIYTNISAMPLEIFEEIFVQCLCQHTRRQKEIPFVCLDCDVGPDDYGSCNPVYKLENLPRVCRSWDSFFWASPRLWTNIPANEGSYDVAATLKRSKRMPLFVQMDLLYYEDLKEGMRRKEAIESLRHIFKRMHRIEDLTICNWTGILEQSLLKYQAYDAPRLRRLVMTARDEFAGRFCPPESQFSFILSSPCPILKVLVLQDFCFSSIRPSMLPSLQELHFELIDMEMTHTLDDVLTTLRNLPLLKTLYLSQDWPSQYFDTLCGFACDENVVLPNLQSLALCGFPICILKYLELPASTHVSITADYDACLHRTDIFDILPALVSSYVTRMSTITGDADMSIDAACLTVKWNLVDIAFDLRSSPTSSVVRTIQVHCAYFISQSSPKPLITDLCRAVGPLDIRKFEVIHSRSLHWRHVRLNWTEFMRLAPQLQELHVQGERSGRALFLAHNRDIMSNPSDSLRGLQKLVLRPWFPLKHAGGTAISDTELDQRLNDYVTRLTYALRLRKKQKCTVKALEIDAGGLFGEASYLKLVRLVGCLTVHNSKTSEPQPVTSEHSGERTEDTSENDGRTRATNQPMESGDSFSPVAVVDNGANRVLVCEERIVPTSSATGGISIGASADGPNEQTMVSDVDHAAGELASRGGETGSAVVVANKSMTEAEPDEEEGFTSSSDESMRYSPWEDDSSVEGSSDDDDEFSDSGWESD